MTWYSTWGRITRPWSIIFTNRNRLDLGHRVLVFPSTANVESGPRFANICFSILGQRINGAICFLHIAGVLKRQHFTIFCPNCPFFAATQMKAIFFYKVSGMLHHSFGGAVIFLSLQHFIAFALDLMPCLQARGKRDCNKGIKFKKVAFNCCNERKITAPIQMCGIFSEIDILYIISSCVLFGDSNFIFI